MKNYTIAKINLAGGGVATVEFPVSSDELKKAISLVSDNGTHNYTISYTEGFYYDIPPHMTLEELSDIANRVDALEKLDGDKFEAMTKVCDSLEQIERCWDYSFFVPWWADCYDDFLVIMDGNKHKGDYHKSQAGIVFIPIELVRKEG